MPEGLVDIAELRTRFTGDLSDLQAKSKQAQEITAQTAAAMTASLKGAGDGFADIGGRINGVAPLITATGTAFTNFGSTVVSTFNQVGAASQSASNIMSSSLSGVQATATAIPVSLSAISSEAQILGQSVANSGQTASAGLVPISAAASAASQAMDGAVVSASDFAAQITSNRSAIGAYELEIANARSGLATLSQKIVDSSQQFGSNSQVVRDLKSEYASLGASTKGLVADKAQLILETKGLQAAMLASVGGTAAVGGAQKIVGNTAEELGKKTSLLSALMHGHSTQLTSQGTIWKGYDNVIQAVIRTMGGLPILVLLAITVLGVLAEKMLRSKDAAKDLKDITDDLVKSDLLLASAFSTLQERTSSTTQSFANQAEVYRELIAVDVGAAIVKFAESFKQAQEEIKKSELALRGYETSQAAVNEILEMAKGSTIDYTDLLGIARKGIDNATESLNTETVARDKNDQEMRKAVAAMLVLYESGVRTIPQLEEMALKALGAGAAFDRLQAELLKATSAQEQLNAAAANYRPPKLDATLQTYDQLRAAVNANVADLEKAGRSQGEILIAIKPQLEAVKKAIIEKSAAELTGTGTSIKNAAAQKFLSDELQRGGDKAAEYAGKIPLLDKNIKALSSTTDAHAKSAGGARAAISQYADGVIGLGKAYDLVAKSISSGAINTVFEDLPKKARAGASGIADAIKAVLANINDLLKRESAGRPGVFEFDSTNVKIMASDLKALGVSGVEAFKTTGEAVKAFEEKLRSLRAAELLDAVKAGTVFQITSQEYEKWGTQLEEKAKEVGGTIEVTFLKQRNIMDAVEMAWKANSVENKKILDDIAFEHERSAARAENAWNEMAKNFPINKFKAALKDLQNTIASNPVFEEAKLKDQAAKAFEGVERILQQEGERLGQSQSEINANILTELSKMKATLPPEMQAAADLAIAAFKRGMDKLPGALDEIFNKLALGAKSKVAGLFQVIDSIPGKFGDALRKSTNEVVKWVDQIDGVLKGLHKIFAAVPDGLAGIAQSIADFFKHTTKTAKDSAKEAEAASQDWAGSLEKLSKGSQDTEEKTVNAFSLMSSAVAGFTAGLSIAAATSSKALGAIGGAAMGALQGFQIAGPWGALVGGISGLLGGLFGGGKSALQKAQEAAALQKAKDDIKLSIDAVLKSAQDVIQAGIETFNKAIAFFFTLDEFTSVRREKFDAFFADLQIMMDYFAAQAKNWATDSLTQMKAVAETFGPVAEAMSALPAVFDGIRAHVDIRKRQFGVFFSDLDRLMRHFFDLASEWADGTAKQAGKVAEQLKPVIDIFSPLINAIKSMADIERPANSAFKALFNALERFVSHIGEISDLFDKSVLKSIQNFAEKVAPATDLWKSITDGIKGMADLTMPPDSAFEAIFIGIEKVVTGMMALADRLSTDSLDKAESIANASLAIFASIKAGVEALTSLNDYKGVLPDVFSSFYNDFNAAVDMLISMNTRAAQFEIVSHIFEDYIAGGAASLNHAFVMLSQIMNAAGAFFPGGAPTVPDIGTTSANGGGGSIGILSLGSVPLSSSSPPKFSNPVASHTTNNFTIVQEAPPPSALTSESNWREWQRNWWREKKARALSMNINIPDYLTE